jgi:hypothetical protein
MAVEEDSGFSGSATVVETSFVTDSELAAVRMAGTR